MKCVNEFGTNSWDLVGKRMPGKSEIKCHARWLELNNATVADRWTEEEDVKLIKLVTKHGPQRWNKLSMFFPGRIK